MPNDRHRPKEQQRITTAIKVLQDAGNNQPNGKDGAADLVPTRDGPEPAGNGIDHKTDLDRYRQLKDLQGNGSANPTPRFYHKKL